MSSVFCNFELEISFGWPSASLAGLPIWLILKADFEILAFFEHLWLVLEIKKHRTK